VGLITYYLYIIFLKKVKITKTISFLATKRLPQLGQLDKKEKYSLILVLFHLREHEIQIISKSNHHLRNKKPHKCGVCLISVGCLVTFTASPFFYNCSSSIIFITISQFITSTNWLIFFGTSRGI
jgi:hypothetical protein